MYIFIGLAIGFCLNRIVRCFERKKIRKEVLDANPALRVYVENKKEKKK